MSDNLLRDAMICEARRWLNPFRSEYASVIDYKLDFQQVAELCADFVMHMTEQKAPELRYVSEDEDDTR